MSGEKSSKKSSVGGRYAGMFMGVKYFGKLALLPSLKWKIDGSEHLPEKGPFVLLSKHQRWEDILLVSFAVPGLLYYVAKHELFDTKFKKWFFNSIGGIPLNRENPMRSRQSIRAIIDFLNQGERIVIFPEGTYFENEMGPGNIGIVKLILSRLSVPFVPMGINYAENGKRTKVQLRIGEPIYRKPEDTAETFLERTMSEIAKLSGMSNQNISIKGS